jgi:hypothetical protein
MAAGGVYDGGFHGAETVLRVSGSYIRLVGGSEWNPKRDGLQFAKLYFKAENFTFKPGKTRGGLKYKCVRENPTDPTFYNTVPVDVDWLDGGALNHSFASFEQGEHQRNLSWSVKCAEPRAPHLTPPVGVGGTATPGPAWVCLAIRLGLL